MLQNLPHEPHKIKTIRRVDFSTLEERRKSLSQVHFNVFHVPSSQVAFDMCSLGTSAMTQEQLSGQLIGDEAYAGARNFEALESAVSAVLGFEKICPVHNILGAAKLVGATMALKGSDMPSNARTRSDVLSPQGVNVIDIRDHGFETFTGNVDLAKLQDILQAGQVSVVGLQLFADGMHPISLENLAATHALCQEHGKRLVIDTSRVIENAWYIQHFEKGQAERAIAELVKEMAQFADVLLMDAAQDPKCPSGGLIASHDDKDMEAFRNEVVVYEGLHTYGGMAGRTMEMFARGLNEMCIEEEVQWVMQETLRFCNRMRDAGVPLERGCDGAYIDAIEFFPHLNHHHQDAFSASLYLISGVRAFAHGRVGRDSLVAVQIPRLAMTSRQLDQVGDAIISLYNQRDLVSTLEPMKTGAWRDQMQYRWVFPQLDRFEFDTYPFTIHTIERISTLNREQRQAAIEAAGYNTFLLRSADVTIDLLTDSGTTAMSTDQWAAYNAAQATPATSDDYLWLVDVLRDATGYQHILPTHQGRAAEQILSEIMIKPGQYVPGNMYFTTTKLHQEIPGGIFADIICDEASQPQSEFPWKGNIDLDKLKVIVDEHGAEKVSYISFEFSVNMAGGQPVSIDNMREVYAYCNPLGIPVFFDATRMVENAYLIQVRDDRYAQTAVRDILLEMLMYGDGMTVSGKKDFLINIGGLLAFKDNAEWAEAAQDKLRLYEGSITDGGLATSDLAAIAVGVEEMLEDDYIRSRVRQTAALGQMLIDAGVPIVTPPGSHAIFVDVKQFLPHVSQDEFPAQRLASELYVETGVRAMERGIVSKGRNAETGENYHPELELIRLTIPRRAYTRDHMREVANGIIRLYEKRETIGGLKFVYEPEKLRFFQSRFSVLPVAAAVVS
ncbi:MAG: tryptophanase [Planctomycetes bacterium]|nr:tryptophanase [Planctomycetota bacterium]